MRLRRYVRMLTAGAAAIAALSLQAVAAPSPRFVAGDAARDTLVVQVQQQGQVKNNTAPRNTAKSSNTNRSNANRSTNNRSSVNRSNNRTTSNRSNTNRSNTNRTTSNNRSNNKSTSTNQRTNNKVVQQQTNKQTNNLNKNTIVKMPNRQAMQKQARQLQLANRNQVRGNFKPAVYQSKLNSTFQSKYKQTPVVGKIRLAPPNWKHNSYMLAGLKGYRTGYRPFWFRFGGRPWYRWYYTALLGGVTYWYWANLTQEEVVEQKVVLTSYASGDCGCEAPPPAPPECDCDDDDCGEQG